MYSFVPYNPWLYWPTARPTHYHWTYSITPASGCIYVLNGHPQISGYTSIPGRISVVSPYENRQRYTFPFPQIDQILPAHVSENISGTHWTANSFSKMDEARKKIDIPPATHVPEDSELYLELDNSSIHNNVAHAIETLGNWFQGEIIDVAFELLEKNPFNKGASFAFIGTTQAESCCRVSEDDFDPIHYALELKRFKDKSLIFFPISDAYGKQEYSDQPEGSHWSLLLIHIRGEQIQARYYDSSMLRNPETEPGNFRIAQNVFKGFQTIYYGKDKQKVPLVLDHIDRNSPSQSYNNACEADTGAACGPFVYEMARGISHYITCYGLAKESAPLPWFEDLAREEVLLDSKAIRENVWRLIYQERERQE